MNTQEAIDKVNELSGKLDTATAILAKVKDESTASVLAIADLKAALEDAQQAGGQITPELEAAITAASEKAGAVNVAATAADDVVIDPTA